MSIPDAILEMVEAALPADVDVYDGRVPDTSESGEPPARYVVLYMDNGTRSADAVDAVSSSRTFRWQVTSVAPDRGMAAWLANEVADALTDARPAAAGWATGQIEHAFSRTPRPDEQVLERPVLVAIDQYELLATRVPVPDAGS